MLISYDFSYRWFEKERWEKVCPNVDFAFLSCSDLDDEKTEELTRSLIQAGCGAVIATRGGKDVVFIDSEETSAISRNSSRRSIRLAQAIRLHRGF